MTSKEILKWLRERLRDVEKRTREMAKMKDYAEAHYSSGLAAAYAYTILHVESGEPPSKRIGELSSMPAVLIQRKGK